jgi:hypothetical protein
MIMIDLPIEGLITFALVGALLGLMMSSLTTLSRWLSARRAA